MIEADLHALKAAGADGLVVGLLLDDGRVDELRLRRIVRLAAPLPVTFHRAIDVTPDPVEALHPISHLYLPYISPVSPLYLPCISPISRLYLPYTSSISPLYLFYISPVPPLFLPYTLYPGGGVTRRSAHRRVPGAHLG